jgi:hypothetical protein
MKIDLCHKQTGSLSEYGKYVTETEMLYSIRNQTCPAFKQSLILCVNFKRFAIENLKLLKRKPNFGHRDVWTWQDKFDFVLYQFSVLK